MYIWKYNIYINFIIVNIIIILHYSNENLIFIALSKATSSGRRKMCLIVMPQSKKILMVLKMGFIFIMQIKDPLFSFVVKNDLNIS